jgi:hypothetical protein
MYQSMQRQRVFTFCFNSFHVCVQALRHPHVEITAEQRVVLPPRTTYERLRQVGPKYVGGGYGVFELVAHFQGSTVR